MTEQPTTERDIATKYRVYDSLHPEGAAYTLPPRPPSTPRQPDFNFDPVSAYLEAYAAASGEQYVRFPEITEALGYSAARFGAIRAQLEGRIAPPA